MKYFDWDTKKNEKLKRERGICFEDVVPILQEGGHLEILVHHNAKRYPNQKLFTILVDEYVHLVPFVEDEEKVFLKTIIPSRKATKQYIMKSKRKKL